MGGTTMKNTDTTVCLNGELKCGDLVIVEPRDEYGCLIGRVLEINLLGSETHGLETDNDMDDVHVDFTTEEYSPLRIQEIEDMFSSLYGVPKVFGECPIDDTIMSPDSLIRITGISPDTLHVLLDSFYIASVYCDALLAGEAKRHEHLAPAQSRQSKGQER